MNHQANRVFLAVAWIASVATAYFLGQSGTNSAAGSSQALPDAESRSAAARQESRRTVRVVEAAGADSSAENAATDSGTVANLIARARTEMGSGMDGMMNIRGMLRAIAPLAELTDAQLQEALSEVDRSVREPQQRMIFLSLLLGQWAESDGPAALAYAEEKVKSKGPFDFGVRASVIGTWARREPDAVWRWFQKEREKGTADPNAQMTMSAVFAGMAAKDLDSAFARLGSLDEQERKIAVNGIAATGGNEHSRRRLIDRAETLTPDLRRQVHEHAVRTWAMTDPEGAVKWLRTRPEEDQPALRTAAGGMLMMADPQRGAEILMEGVAEKDKPRTYDTIIGQWAYRDPRAAGEWLTKQSQGPELDGARRTFASTVVERDPGAAMDWAKSVTNPEQRAESVQQIYSRWARKDAPAAGVALDGSGLPPEKIAELKQAAANTKPTRPEL